MPAIWRVQDRSTFDELRRRGRRHRCGPVTVTWVAGPEGDPPRVAFAIGRSVGNAVTRNRVRRRLRAVMSELAPDLPPGAYLIRASPGAVTLTFDEMRTTVSSAIAAVVHGRVSGARREAPR